MSISNAVKKIREAALEMEESEEHPKTIIIQSNVYGIRPGFSNAFNIAQILRFLADMMEERRIGGFK